MLKKTISFALCLALVLTLCSCGGNQSTPSTSGQTPAPSGQTLSLRMAVEDYKNEFTTMYAYRLKEEVETKSNGRITLTIYPEGQLSSGADQVELLQTGACELALIYMVSVATVIPEANLCSLHYLLPNDLEVVDKIFNEGETIKLLSEAYEAKGLYCLDFLPRTFNVWSANKEIRTPADMKGFKMRTTATPILTKAYQLYGANPTATTYSELYSALQLKMVDGQTNPLITAVASKYNEVQDYMMVTNAENMVLTFNANKSFWDGLSEEDKAIINDAIDVANAEIPANRAAGFEEALKIAQDSGTTIIYWSGDEQAEFQKLAGANYATFVEMAGENGQKLLDSMLADIEKFSN